MAHNLTRLLNHLTVKFMQTRLKHERGSTTRKGREAMRKWNNLKRDMYRREPVMGRPDLQIRNLLDDPALRRAMGLDLLHAEVTVAATQVSLMQRPQRRFDRRMLLEGVA